MKANAGQQLSTRESRNAATDRLLTFTDGVFAIIITIIVLDIRVPDLGSGQSLADALWEIQPTFVAFILSFLLVGMYWVWHRGAFSQVRYVDLNSIWLNLLFLLPVSLLPFAASTLGEHPTDATALHIYGAALVAATLMRVLLLAYLHRHAGLLWEPSSRQGSRLAFAAAASPVAVYIIAMAVAERAPTLSLILYFSVPLLYFGLVAFLKTDPKTESHAEDLS
jgi:uncharacterized membrane protein